MRKYQIVEKTNEFNHAGSKATADIAEVAEKMGFQRIPITMDTFEDSFTGKLRRQAGYARDWANALRCIPEGSLVLLQHPFHHKQLTREKTLFRLKNEKNVRFLSLVHDVEELRAYRYDEYYAREFQTMLKLADMLIVHNNRMRDWFEEQGVPAKRMIGLEIFDYLYTEKIEKTLIFDRSISVAGNLDTQKCGYIARLGELKGLPVHLYGPNYDNQLDQWDNIVYHGSFPADEIPAQLCKGFGLVWDGKSLDNCSGLSGQYLRYNNPHKLSLYLASGLPVIIWKHAAEAEFVQKNGLGLCVESLFDLPDLLQDISLDQWQEMLLHVEKTGEKLRRGDYSRRAIEAAAKAIE